MRRVALVTFNSAAHNKPSLVRDLLLPPETNGHQNGNDKPTSSLIQFLYNETKVKLKSLYIYLRVNNKNN